MKTTMSLAAAMGAFALAATSANAATTITGSSYSSSLAAGGGIWNDGTNNTTGGVTWGSSELFDGVKDGGVGVVGWDNVVGPILTFDLGTLYDVQTIDMWVRNSHGTILTLDISVSTDDLTYSPALSFAPPVWTGPTNSATDQFDVSSLPNARYVKFSNITTGDWTMITEVEFNGDAIPEPSTTALLGLGGLALILRRRK